jgi:quercetin dioxygenase-like cupin family protein
VRLSLYERPEGVETTGGPRVVYDVARGEARFGAAAVEGRALVWELEEKPGPDAALSAEVVLDPAVGWIVRCDRIDFPPGGVAYRHTHPGPGIRRLLFGQIRIDTQGSSRSYEPGGAWFEAGPDPVFAAASPSEDTAFVRVMLLPREWEGKRTIRYVDPADEDKPKLQRATVYFDRPLDLR